MQSMWAERSAQTYFCDLRSPLRSRSAFRSFLGEIASCSASDFAYSYPLLRGVVCRLWSVVCHSSPKLRISHDRYTCGVQWHIVFDGSLTPKGRGDLGEGVNSQPKLALAYLWFTRGQHAPISDFASYRITSATCFRLQLTAPLRSPNFSTRSAPFPLCSRALIACHHFGQHYEYLNSCWL